MQFAIGPQYGPPLPVATPQGKPPGVGVTVAAFLDQTVNEVAPHQVAHGIFLQAEAAGNEFCIENEVSVFIALCRRGFFVR